MNEIVKYHNDMATVSFPGFTAMQHNIIAALCYECKDKGTKKHPIKISYLKKLAGYESKDDGRFIGYLDDLSDRLFNLEYRENKDDGGFKKFVLFTYFETENLKTKDAVLWVGVSEDFEYILNNNNGKFPLLASGYTTFELQQHNSLRSTYSKQCFKHLKRFKRTGWWKVSIGEFRRLLDIPENYRMSEINKRVLKPIMDELPAYFKNLKIETEKERGSKRQIAYLKFTFEPQLEKGIWTEREIRETEYYCRYCKQPLYAIFKDEGDMFYGHKDGYKPDALCKRTYSSIDEILGFYEPPSASSGSSGYLERSGFSCSECGRPLYILYNKKGEMFYGHPDGGRPDARCKKTYSSVAEIKGWSETPTRSSPNAYDLVEEGYDATGAYGIFKTNK